MPQLRFDYDTTTVRRYHDAFDDDESDRNYDLRSIWLRRDYDMTTMKNWHVHFLEWNWKQAHAIRRSRIVVELQLFITLLIETETTNIRIIVTQDELKHDKCLQIPSSRGRSCIDIGNSATWLVIPQLASYCWLLGVKQQQQKQQRRRDDDLLATTTSTSTTQQLQLPQIPRRRNNRRTKHRLPENAAAAATAAAAAADDDDDDRERKLRRRRQSPTKCVLFAENQKNFFFCNTTGAKFTKIARNFAKYFLSL